MKAQKELKEARALNEKLKAEAAKAGKKKAAQRKTGIRKKTPSKAPTTDPPGMTPPVDMDTTPTTTASKPSKPPAAGAASAITDEQVRKAAIEKHIREQGATVDTGGGQTVKAKTEAERKAAHKRAADAAIKAGKLGVVGGAIGLGLTALSAGEAYARTEGSRAAKVKAAGKSVGTEAKVGLALGAAAKAAPKALGLAARFAGPIGLAYEAYRTAKGEGVVQDLMEAYSEGKKALSASISARREKAASEKKYGTVEAATATRHALRAAAKKKVDEKKKKGRK
jgi:hypothetical protein